MMDVVPESYRRPVKAVFVTQRAQARRAQHQDNCICYFECRPSRGQQAEKVSTGKKEDISLYARHAIRYPVGSRRDLLRRFAFGTSIAEELPNRTFRLDLGGTPAFVFAVTSPLCRPMRLQAVSPCRAK
jgi:hypothetical protein